MGHEITDEYIYLNCSKKHCAQVYFLQIFFSILDIFGNDVDGKRPKPCLRKLAKELAQTPLSGRETSQQPRTGH